MGDPLAEFLWFCQLSGDGEFVGAPPTRRPTLEYMASLVDTAAEMGFSSLLTATNFHAEHDAFTASVAVLARTRGAGLLIAVRPGMFNPAVFAKMAATAAGLFPGRVRLNVVTGSNPVENRMYGDHEDRARRYARTRDFLTIVRRLLSEPTVDFESPRYRLEGARVAPRPDPPIPIYLGGASEEAQQIAAELADVYLLWADQRDVLRGHIASVTARARDAGRAVAFGLRCHVVVRETEGEAWRAAERLVSRIDPSVKKSFERASREVDSVGQKRQTALAGGESLVIEEHLWAGVGLARSGVGVAIVGDPSQVERKLRGYLELGITTFILSGYPHLEECRRVGELVLPRFQARGEAPSFAMAPRGVAPVV